MSRIIITAAELVKEIGETLDIDAIEVSPDEYIRLGFVPLTLSSTMVTKVKFIKLIRQINIVQITILPLAVDSKMDIVTNEI